MGKKIEFIVFSIILSGLIILKHKRNIQRLMDDMLETLYAAPGIGLAAIQVGVAKRVIVIDTSRGREKEPKKCRENKGPNVHI